MRRQGRILLGVLGIALAVTGIGLTGVRAAEAPATGEFNLQVTPSPLVTTVKPGTKTDIELKVRNNGTVTEKLKIEPRSFTLDDDSTNINLLDTAPAGISEWISFSEPNFTAQPGQWATQKITFDIPESAGFSYSFALLISRQESPQTNEGGRLLEGSIAIFTLINIDRPGATSSLEVVEFKTTQGIYEYLPAAFTIGFKNTGNTIVQPYGNIFVERGDDAKPLGTLPVNDARAYILPETTRTIDASWTDGFPAYQTIQNSDGTTSRKLVWDWAKIGSLRIGRYTAKLVGVYNQGGRDVPIQAEVSFWVIPWKILGGALLIVLLILFALFMLVRTAVRSIRRRGKRSTPKTEKKD